MFRISESSDHNPSLRGICLALGALGSRIHAISRAHGFYDRETIKGDPNPSLPAEKLALIHSEVSETLDALRDGNADHEGEELADIIIRTLDYCAWRRIDIARHVREKIAVNADRPPLHGRRF